jgi:hypothetical protein
MAYDELLARYHRTVLKVADGHMPHYWRARRLSLRDKHTNTVFYEDLVAAGVAAMWRAALKFDLEAGYRFWTGVRAAVLGAISDEARLWRRGGSGESRLDRWLYTHPTASPDQVLVNQQRLYRVEERLARWLSEHPDASPEEILKKRERINRLLPFHSLQEAAEGIKQFWAWGSDAEIDFDEDTEPTGSFASMYSCFNWYMLSPQLEIHERFNLIVDRLSGGFAFGRDLGNVSRPKAPRDLRDCTETALIRFKNGKRQVTRQKALPGYRIAITAALQAKAKEDLEFTKQRWQRRIRRGPMPAKQYSRWSTIGETGRAEHENNKLFPLMSRSHDSHGKLNTAALRETFYRYWNLPRGTAITRTTTTRNSRANFVKKFAVDRARIMSRFHHYHPRELWVVGPPPWTHDLRTPEQSRER